MSKPASKSIAQITVLVFIAFVLLFSLSCFLRQRGGTKVPRSVTPVKTGVQNPLFLLDSGFRRNDEKGRFLTFQEGIKDEKG
jgi:hypothetical protein